MRVAYQPERLYWTYDTVALSYMGGNFLKPKENLEDPVLYHEERRRRGGGTAKHEWIRRIEG